MKRKIAQSARKQSVDPREEKKVGPTDGEEVQGQLLLHNLLRGEKALGESSEGEVSEAEGDARKKLK